MRGDEPGRPDQLDLFAASSAPDDDAADLPDDVVEVGQDADGRTDGEPVEVLAADSGAGVSAGHDDIVLNGAFAAMYMARPGASSEEAGSVEQVVLAERVIRRDCETCGQEFAPKRGRGRPPRFCSPACRQRAWALRQAAAMLGTEQDRRPEVVREFVAQEVRSERVILRTVRAPAPAMEPALEDTWSRPDPVPTRGREWAELLAQLQAQLRDETSPVAREHWAHRRLYDALIEAVVAVGFAHPGGLEQLDGRR